MASHQLRRENVADERKIEVEKDKVPKMTTHFESLAEKARGGEVPLHGERVHQFEAAVPVRVSGVEYASGPPGEKREEMKGKEEEGETDQKRRSQMHTAETEEKEGREAAGGIGHERMERKSEGGAEGRKEHSLEEVSDLRATAQQNSMEAIRAAEERYQKAKETGAPAMEKVKESTVQGMQTGRQYAAEKGGDLKDTAMEKTQQAKDYAMEKGQQAKDVLWSKGQTAAEYTAEKAKAAKDTAMDTTMTAAGYVGEKATAAKDTTMDTTKTAAQYAAEKARAAKDTAVDTTKTAAGYVGEKAVAAKDVTVESGKGAAGYAGKVASEVKDQAVVAGWGAAHYTLEKVAEATKAVAGVTSSVAGYTGEKAAVAKDKVVGFAGEKIAAAKDVVVATEEKAADYAARKQEEAKRGLEAKKLSPHEKEEGQGIFTSSTQQREKGGEQIMEHPVEKIKETFQQGGGESEQIPIQGGGGGTVFHAIGETLVEIGQTTKDLLVGQYPSEVIERKDEEKHHFGENKDTGEGI